MRKVYVVLIHIGCNHSRRLCEDMETETIEVKEYLTALKVRDSICDKYDIPPESLEVEPMTDFMDRVNNQEFISDNYFMSYVYGEKGEG